MRSRRSEASRSGIGALLLLILIFAICGRGDRRTKTVTNSGAPPKHRRGRAIAALMVSPLIVVGLSLLIWKCDDVKFVAGFLAFISDAGAVLAFTGAMAALSYHHFSATGAEPKDVETQGTWDRFMLLSLFVAAVGGLMLALDGGVGLLNHLFGSR